MSTQVESHAFQAEVKEVLSLVIHSLYTDRDIFLRELISNASDALDKLRFEALTHPEYLESGETLGIALETDSEGHVLRIADNGIGMDREDLVGNLGKIASSGTRRFLEALKDSKGQDAPQLIGRFGVGFYSAFMVADRVTVETRRAGSETGWRWSSDGEGEYTLEEAEGLARGTVISLHLKTSEDEEKDYTQEWVLRDIVGRYSDFVEYPIQMEVERSEPKLDEKGEEIEGEYEETRELVTLNSQKPLWNRPKSEITEEEYNEFYRHHAHDWAPPLETIHFKVEGTLEFTSLLFLPSQRPGMFQDSPEPKSKLSLYVRRVLVQRECEELLAPWLRFVRGVVETADLPLNVSRETMQNNAAVAQIKKGVQRKVLESLRKLQEGEREKYEKFWGLFGAVLKEGLYFEHGDLQAQIARLGLFQHAGGEGWISLAEYIEAMPADQEAIYVLPGASRELIAGSAHLEGLRKKGFDVLYLTDPVDEWVLQRLHEFDGRKLTRIDQGELELDGEAEKQALEAESAEYAPLLEGLGEALEERVTEVRLSSRLAESPAVLVEAGGGLSAHQARLLRQSGQDVPEPKRILELNPQHPLVLALRKLQSADPKSPRLADFGAMLLDGALLREGEVPADPAAFQKRLTELMVASLG
ncbi:MAG: molecular chaperone HtpG [Planctomycetota bacterium]